MKSWSVLVGLIAALTTATVWAEPTPAQREVYQRYMAFHTLVDRCNVPTRWTDDGNGVWFTDRALFPTQAFAVDSAGQRKALLDVERLRASVARELGVEPPPGVIPADSGTLELGGGQAEFTVSGQRVRVNLADYSAQRIRGPESVEKFFGTSVEDRFTPRAFKRELFMVGLLDDTEVMSPDRAWFASLRDGNLWLRGTVDGRAAALTTDGTPDVAWDLETGAVSPWSPDGSRLFAARYDRTLVPKIPILHPLRRTEEVSWSRLQKAGTPLDRASLYIVPVLGGKPVAIDLGDTTDYYFRELGWLSDSSAVLFARFSRDFKRADVIAADALTGAPRTLLTESGPTFVRIQHNIIWGGGDSGFTLLPGSVKDKGGFIWQSERDGTNQLYLYDLQGKLLRQPTRGEAVVHQVSAIDDAGGWVYYTAGAMPRPYDSHLYRVALKGSAPQKLTEGEGSHRVRLSPSRKVFVDTWSSVAKPPRTELRSVDGKLLQVLGEADVSRLKAVGWSAPEEFTVKAADGKTDLWGVMYKPYDFDPSRKYPLIEYIYGGPQTANLPVDFCGNGSDALVDLHFPRALAQLGYVVAIVAGRGTPGRSKAFQDVTYGDWADHVVADHAGAMRQLGASRSYIDLARVGIFGRSWGGYFSFRLLADAGDVYKAAVSVVPGFDPYNGILYEPYLGLPDENRAAYEAASPFRLAPKVKGSLLMVGGTLDTSTYHDILRMANALIDAKVHHELLILPNQEHAFGGAPADFMRDEIARFFDAKLGATK